MFNFSRHSTASRLGVALSLAGGLALVSAGGASALDSPLPTGTDSSSPLSSLTSALTTATAPLTSASSPAAPAAPAPAPAAAPAPAEPRALPLNLVVVVPLVDQAPLPASPVPPFAGTPAPQPLTDGLIEVSTGVKSALNQVGAGMAETPMAPLAPSGDPAAVANIVVQAAPLATVCVQATGTNTSLLNTDLTALGIDISSPLIQTFPGFLSPCPQGTVPAPGTTPGVPAGSSPAIIAGADAAAGSLLGACVRVTTSVVPLQSTLMVLNQDVIAKLTEAGVPLEQLIVPCPVSGTADGTPTPDNGGGTPGTGTGNGNGTGAGAGSGDISQASSAFPASGSLPFTGAEVGLLLAMAAALIAAGTAIVRKARAAQWAVRI